MEKGKDYFDYFLGEEFVVLVVDFFACCVDPCDEFGVVKRDYFCSWEKIANDILWNFKIKICDFTSNKGISRFKNLGRLEF